MKVFEAWHQECIFESAPMVISLHWTKEGATEAMEKHKQKAVNAREKSNRRNGTTWTVDDFQAWGVKEHQLKD